jgi:hypothetical protein
VDVIQRRAERVDVDQVELVGLVDGGLGVAAGGGQVDQGLDGGGDGDAVPQRRRDVGAAVDDDALPLPIRPRRHGDVDRAGSAPAHLPDLTSRVVTQGGLVTAGLYGGNEEAKSAQSRRSDDIDAAPRRGVQPPVAEPVLDAVPREAERQQLRPSQHVMLPTRQRPRRSPRLQLFTAHSRSKAAIAQDSPPTTPVSM